MAQGAGSKYFFSIQPFWERDGALSQISDLSGQIMASPFRWRQESISCVPGNGQVGIMVRGPENFGGYCFGVMSNKGELPLHGMKEGCFVRFSPGTFSQICGIPAKLIDPEGVPVEDLFSRGQLEQIRDALAQQSPAAELIRLFSRWAEEEAVRSPRERQLAGQVTRLIWENRGNIRVRELEEETTYSARYLQEVVTRQVGVCPKQMCSQIRFQHILRTMQERPEVSQSQMAQTMGFSDQAHYCREFKRFCGLSPTEYQKRIVG